MNAPAASSNVLTTDTRSQTITQSQLDAIPKMEPQAKMDALNALLRKKLITASHINQIMHYTAVEKSEASM